MTTRRAFLKWTVVVTGLAAAGDINSVVKGLGSIPVSCPGSVTIYGQKTLTSGAAMSMINMRRLIYYVKREITKSVSELDLFSLYNIEELNTAINDLVKAKIDAINCRIGSRTSDFITLCHDNRIKLYAYGIKAEMVFSVSGYGN